MNKSISARSASEKSKSISLYYTITQWRWEHTLSFKYDRTRSPSMIYLSSFKYGRKEAVLVEKKLQFSSS